MSICLTQREILELTRETLPSAQIRVLETLGIPFVARSNGFVGVLRATIEQRNGRLRRLWRQYWEMEDRYHEQLEAWRQRCFDMFLASGKRIDKDAYPERPEPPELPAELRGLTCGAKTRKGTFCKRRDLYTNGRCRMHGGPSTGPTSEAGKQRSALNGQHRKQRSQDVRGNDRWSKGAEPNP